MAGCGEDGDRGYDPTVREPYPTERAQFVEVRPPAAIVNPAFLPPVGQQGTTASGGSPGTCCAWASVYGLATFAAARAGRVDPSKPSGQASAAQLYIEALIKRKVDPCSCADTSFSDYFPLLEESGAQSLADAPYIRLRGALARLPGRDGQAARCIQDREAQGGGNQRSRKRQTGFGLRSSALLRRPPVHRLGGL
jgi:hypothetical protein